MVIRGQISQFQIPIERSCLISSLVSFESNIITLSVLQISEVKILWLRCRTVGDKQRSNIILPIDCAWVVSYSNSTDPHYRIITVSVVKMFDVKFAWFWTKRAQVSSSPFESETTILSNINSTWNTSFISTHDMLRRSYLKEEHSSAKVLFYIPINVKNLFDLLLSIRVMTDDLH